MDRFALIKNSGYMSLSKRESLPSKSFAIPASKAKKIGVAGQIQGKAKGKYPIPDLKHARNALARVSQHGTLEERMAVRRKVYSKYPQLRGSFKERHGESPTSKENIGKVKMAEDIFSEDPIKLMPRLKQIHKFGDFPVGNAPEDLDAQHQSPGKVKSAAGLLGSLMGASAGPVGRVPSISEQYYMSGMGETGDDENMPLELLMMAGPQAAQGAQMVQMAKRLAQRKGRQFEQKAMDREEAKAQVVNALAAELAKLQMEKKGFKLQGKTEVQGIPVAIENKPGSVRSGVDKDGEKWETKMRVPYGYIKGTKGADGEEVDAFVGPKKDAKDAYVVHQHKPDGKGYDEDKIMLGFPSKAEAKKTFLQHYDDPKFLGPISRVSMERLKELVATKKKLVKISQVSYRALLDEIRRCGG